MQVLLISLGAATLRGLEYIGQLAGLLGEVVSSLTAGKIRFREMCRQLVAIGFGSQFVVMVTGAFTGAVFTAQIIFKFKDLGLESAAGALVSVAMCRELGPVLTALMVTGRVGGAMAAEIGTMKVTEQIDALRALAVHPVDYLVLPRVVGMLISIPLLIAEAIAVGIVASRVLAVTVFKIPEAWYWAHVTENTEFEDIFIGMTKGFIFGLLIVLISCHRGLNANNGAVGVGQGTTGAVVASSLAILISNFFLTFLMNMFFPLGEGGGI